jgi:hypothetical protein
MGRGAARVVQLGELMMILDLHRHGLSVSAIARRKGRDPKTVRKYIERGLELPAYSPRQVGRPGKILPFVDYVRERLAAFPDLTATRLFFLREICERGYGGAYTAVKRFVAALRPDHGPKPFEVSFETPPGLQAQVDFARFGVAFEDDPGCTRIVWLFSLLLGHSRHIFACFMLHQDLQTLLRCHIAAFAAIGGVPVGRRLSHSLRSKLFRRPSRRLQLADEFPKGQEDGQIRSTRIEGKFAHDHRCEHQTGEARKAPAAEDACCQSPPVTQDAGAHRAGPK